MTINCWMFSRKQFIYISIILGVQYFYTSLRDKRFRELSNLLLVTQLITSELGFEPRSVQTYSSCCFSITCLFHIDHKRRKMRIITARLTVKCTKSPLPKSARLEFCSRMRISILIYLILKSEPLQLSAFFSTLTNLLLFPYNISQSFMVVLEKTLESPLDGKEIKLANPKGNQHWIFIGRTNA